MISSCEVHWRKWAPFQKCLDILRSNCLIRKKRPKNLEYQGISSYGTHYYRKTDNSFWIETKLCVERDHKDFGRDVFVKIG